MAGHRQRPREVARGEIRPGLASHGEDASGVPVAHCQLDSVEDRVPGRRIVWRRRGPSPRRAACRETGGHGQGPCPSLPMNALVPSLDGATSSAASKSPSWIVRTGEFPARRAPRARQLGGPLRRRHRSARLPREEEPALHDSERERARPAFRPVARETHHAIHVTSGGEGDRKRVVRRLPRRIERQRALGEANRCIRRSAAK